MTRLEAAAKLTDEVFWRALQSNMAWPPKVGWDAARSVILDALGLPEQEPTCATCQSAWQPIETAPRMRKIIVHYRNCLGKDRTVMACYYEAKSLQMDDDYQDVKSADEDGYAPAGWYEEHDSDEPLLPLQEEPDAWMPLPAPPRPLVPTEAP